MKTKSALWLADDVASGFAAYPEADHIFRALPESHRREYLQWIDEAKKPETRRRRIVQAAEMVMAKR